MKIKMKMSSKLLVVGLSLLVLVAAGEAAARSELGKGAKEAEKKEDAASAASDSEYLHVKPEEVGSLEQLGKAEQLSLSGEPAAADKSDASASSSKSGSPSSSSAADEQLEAHLSQSAGSGLGSAGEPIAELESSYAPYAELAPASSSGSAGPAPGPAPRAAYGQPAAPRPRHAGRPRPNRPHGHHAARAPPSYTTMKGKLTGINSVVSQYPHPAPGYPHQGPRHLPRGAAAGYAAFRDFVRAHASKYKQRAPAGSDSPSHAHMAAPMRPATPTAVGYPRPASGSSQQQQPATKGTKVSVAQAYIPHLQPAAAPGPAPAQQNPAGYDQRQLQQLYGPHLPQGQGRPEYSRDYGMVIHYPQATVYTEPMTVDQLHKLTGAGISQVLAQLQNQLASGHRDESNTIRPNHQGHQLGHGLAIQAKEYLAPGKYGQYVPTTAAVITHNAGEAAGGQGGYNGPQQTSQPQQQGYNGLGSGYERVRQAVAASQQHGRPAGGYPSSGPTEGEPLGAISQFISGELDAIYRQNKAAAGYPEPQSQQPQRPHPQQPRPARYPRGPARPHGPPHQQQRGPRGPRRPRPAHQGRHQGPRLQPRPMAPLPPYRPQPYSQRGRPQQPQSAAGSGYQQQAGSGLASQQQPAAYQQQQQQQEQQALSQQMQQLMQDFQSGEEMYNGRPALGRPLNQGYPHKVLQKHQQQQQQLQAYHQHEGPEIAQGPNDQIGEIADLIEALKSSLESHRPEHQPQPSQPQSQPAEYATPKQAAELAGDVRYLAGALGQAPSYAMQVPVAPEQAQQLAQGYQQQAGQQQQAQGYQQQASQQQQQAQGYQQQSYQQANQQQAYQQQQAGQQQAYQQPAAMFGPASGSYQPQPQPQEQQQQQQQQVTQTSQVVAGTYPQQAPVEQQQQQQQYSSQEHSQLINHLVPLAEPQPASNHQQPANQIAVAAPTDSQYQQAQSLSQFVDSLPSDYQELLRQPALGDSHAHLAIQASPQSQQQQQQQQEPVGAYSSTSQVSQPAPASSSASASATSATAAAASSAAAAAAPSLGHAYQQAAQQAADARPQTGEPAAYSPQQQQQQQASQK